MLAIFVVLAIALSYALGGRLSRYEQAGLKALYLPLLSLAMQSVATAILPPATWDVVGFLFILLSYGLIFAFLFLNRHLKKTAAAFGLGSLCNLLVISLNGFRMPVAQSVTAHLSAKKLEQLLSLQIPMYRAADAHTLLPWLGDVIPLPLLGGMASIGDVLLGVGAFFLVIALMRPQRLSAWWHKG